MFRTFWREVSMADLAIAGAIWICLAGPSLGASPQSDDFALSSPDVVAGSTIAPAHIYNEYGCTGQNLSPALSWNEPPPGTKSFVLTIFDPDANQGEGWWHWIVYDIPGSARGLPRGISASASSTLPAGARQAKSDFGQKAYGGPCPPVGDKPHHYVFTIYALGVEHIHWPDGKIGYPPKSDVFAKSSFTALFGR